MAESTEVQTLEKISTEVDESQFKIILSIHCIKAQAYLVNKLRKQSEQQKQVCSFISSGNFKLETEIKLAEKEVNCILNALETIKKANVELKKEFLLAKERKTSISERVNNGIKKYEELWETSKKRYESIPFIQNYLQIKKRKETLHENVVKLHEELDILCNNISIRKIELVSLDRKYLIEVAKFMVHDRPKLIKDIQDKNKEIDEITSDIQKLTKERGIDRTSKTIPIYKENKDEAIQELNDNSWPCLSTDIDNIMLPKLPLRNVDLDTLTNKLNQMKKVDSQHFKNIELENTVTIEKNNTQNKSTEEITKDFYISSYFQSSKCTEAKEMNDGKPKKYSEKKLINILEDIKLDKTEAYNIISNIKPGSLQDVNMITAEGDRQTNKHSQEKLDVTKENEIIEEINVTKVQSQSILIPPMQFLDFTQKSQEKRVKFDEVVSVQNSDTVKEVSPEEINIADSPSQLNVSTKSDDSYTKIKNTVFKKHNLDLSPQFSYSKNKPTLMKSNNDIVKSKFFIEKDCIDNKTPEVMEIDDKVTDEKVDNEMGEPNQSNTGNIFTNMEEKNIGGIGKSVSGFLFSHGPQGILDSLNVSMSTAFDEEDAEYPHCIDSSLLLSPKADVEMPSTSNDNDAQVHSQEAPNFLSGMRKSAFSFFGSATSENNLNSGSAQNNFTFSFGGDDKKNRGSLFNMFCKQ